MTIEKKVSYICNKCGRKYAIPPKLCDCEKEDSIGAIVGWAKILTEKDFRKMVKVQCLICGEEKEVLFYNIQRQKSCGCVPRSINILAITIDEVRYQCKKCGDISIESVPCEPSCECIK